MDDFDRLVASLPDPETDEKPPPVMATSDEVAQSARDSAFMSALLDPKNDSEDRVKYVLTKAKFGRGGKEIFGAALEKDGDWETSASGRDFYRKRTADFRGGVYIDEGDEHRSAVFVEVKGISPDKSFALSRLTKPPSSSGPSQYKKLTERYLGGDVVWLALCWWDAVPWSEPVDLKQRTRTIKKWRSPDVKLTITLIRWGEFTEEIMPSLRYKSIRQKDRHLLDHCRIYKKGSMWALCPNHWWLDTQQPKS